MHHLCTLDLSFLICLLVSVCFSVVWLLAHLSTCLFICWFGLNACFVALMRICTCVNIHLSIVIVVLLFCLLGLKLSIVAKMCSKYEQCYFFNLMNNQWFLFSSVDS